MFRISQSRMYAVPDNFALSLRIPSTAGHSALFHIFRLSYLQYAKALRPLSPFPFWLIPVFFTFEQKTPLPGGEETMESKARAPTLAILRSAIGHRGDHRPLC